MVFRLDQEDDGHLFPGQHRERPLQGWHEKRGDENDLRNLIFCHFKPGDESSGYSEIDNIDNLRKSVREFVRRF